VDSGFVMAFILSFAFLAPLMMACMAITSSEARLSAIIRQPVFHVLLYELGAASSADRQFRRS